MGSGASRRTRVLFIHPTMSSFIQADLDILMKHFDVRVLDAGSKQGLAGALSAAWRLFRGVMWADVTFSWFAEKHARYAVMFSRVFGRHSIVVVGGYEVTKLPELGFGSLLDPRKARMVRYILTKATMVLPVDDDLRARAVQNLGIDAANFRTVPTGYDSQHFASAGSNERTVVSVGYFSDWTRVRVKGFDTLIEAAKKLPDVKFVIIGGNGDAMAKLKEMAPANVEVLPPMWHDEVIPIYQKAKVYAQLSRTEGLPNALCEAMLCECVPVGTRIPGIEHAIGDAGFYVAV
ncbi:MAG: glycosyltransferase family 4 protein, partial [Thermoplasmata archaeon]|nr:glycosyltransferase family 4 protein [Thermoplasmata archaeon]